MLRHRDDKGYRDSSRHRNSKHEIEDMKQTGLATEYDPVKIGSIDGTDEIPHDRGIARAMRAKYRVNPKIKGVPEHTIFISKLHHQTEENVLSEKFKKFGAIVSCNVIRDIVTGESKGYAFVEYEDSKAARRAYKYMNKEYLDGNRILVDYEAERRLKGWIPRRLGGGFGGKKESGQLRFGCRTRPFREPILINTEHSYKNR